MTVVVPHYNYGAYLPVAVESALDQSGLDVEVIVVDDKSTDGSVAVARRIADADARVRLVEHATNMRHIRTYNDGLSRASGDYVVLLSADDAVSCDAITRSVALLESDPRVGLVYGRVQRFAVDVPAFRDGPTWWQVWSGHDWIRRIAHRGRNAIVNPEVVMRRSVYEDIGGYDPEFPHAGDMFMWLQAAARSDVGFVGGMVQAYYRDHGQNMHSTEFGGVLDDMRQVRDVFERFFTGDGARVDDAAGLLRVARRAVAREALLRGVLLRAEGAPPEVMTIFRDFAHETRSDIDRTSLWALADSRMISRPAALRVARGVEGLRWRYRFRRTDAFGI